MDENQKFKNLEREPEQRRGHQFIYLLIGLVFVVLVVIGVVGYFVVMGETGESLIEEEREVLRTEFYGGGEEGYALEWYRVEASENVRNNPPDWLRVDTHGRTWDADLVYIDRNGEREILVTRVVDATQKGLPEGVTDQWYDIELLAQPSDSSRIILNRIEMPAGSTQQFLFSYDRTTGEIDFMETASELYGFPFEVALSPDKTKFSSSIHTLNDRVRIIDLRTDTFFVADLGVGEKESTAVKISHMSRTTESDIEWLDNSTLRYGVYADVDYSDEPFEPIEYRTVNIEGQQEGQGVHLEYLDGGTVLQVVDGEGSEVLRYSIEEFNQWAAQNWDNVFSEKPAFGELGKVSPAGFSRFDETASLSPLGDRLAFSVGEYRALTTASFVGVLDIESGDVDLVDSVKWGDIEKIIWSFDGDHVAYLLHTARARGDLLSIDNVVNFSNEVTLEGEDIIAALDREGQIDPSEYMPHFNGLIWTGTGWLRFSSDVPGGEEERRGWFIQSDGTDLR